MNAARDRLAALACALLLGAATPQPQAGGTGAAAPGPQAGEIGAATAQTRPGEADRGPAEVVVSVAVDAPEDQQPEELAALVDIAPGAALDAAAVQAAIKRLFALGRFAQVEADATPVAGDARGNRGVLLRFTCRPRRRVAAVTVAGTQVVGAGDLADALGLTVGDEVDARTADLLGSRARAQLSRWGYPAAEVRVRRRDDPRAADTTFALTVREGPPRRLVALHLTGSPRLPETVLRGMIRLRPGRPLSLTQLDRDVATLRRAYIAHGFAAATVGPPQVSGDAATATVTLPIVAGDRIDVRFVGNRLFDDATLRAMWPDAAGAFSPTNLRILRQRVQARYLRAGYPNARVGLRTEVDRGRGIRRYELGVSEGRPAVVEQLTFSGATALSPDLLAAQVEAILARELDEEDLFLPLDDHDAALGVPGDAAPPPPPRAVAPRARYVPDLYEEGARQIAAAYRDLGYLDVEVAPPRARAAGSERGTDLCAGAPPGRGPCPVAVDIPVHEGPQTFVASLRVVGSRARAEPTLTAVVAEATAHRPLVGALTEGAPMSEAAVEDGRIGLVRYFRDQGYLYAQVSAHLAATTAGLWATVRYEVEEGPQVRVAHLLTGGNRHTRAGVIRSRMQLAPGDIYRLDQAVADQRSVSSLGVFNQVRVRLVDEERVAAQKDVVTEVVERPRQPVEVALGMSTANGPRLRLSYAHLNVLGTATTFSASAKVNRQLFFGLFGDFGPILRARYAAYHGAEQLTRALEREIRLGLRSPPLRALPLDPLLRVDLVDQRVNAVRYSYDSQAVILGSDMHSGHRLRGTVEGQIALTRLECDETLDPTCNQAVDVRRLQGRPIDVGDLWLLKGGPLVLWDRRDSAIDPHAGVLVSLRGTYALGGASPAAHLPFEPLAFAKAEASVTGYVPLGRVVLALAARAGAVQIVRSQVPINERFFLGGRDTLRGFVESTLMPADACVGVGPRPAHCAEQVSPGQGGLPLSRGGNDFVLFKSELRLPLAQALTFDVFLDAGNLWLDVRRAAFTLRLGTGVGLRYATPVGALAVDVGVNPSPQVAYGEPRAQLHFSIGAF